MQRRTSLEESEFSKRILVNSGAGLKNAADYLFFDPERPCPLCGGAEHVLLSDKMQFALDCRTVICRECGFCFVSPAPTKAACNRFYQEAYAHYYRKIHRDVSTRMLRETAVEVKRLDLIAQYRPLGGARLLEIGPGAGRFLSLAAGRGADCTAIEPSEEFRNRLSEKGIRVIGEFLEQVATEERFDVICLFQVLEHFHDPVDAMTKIQLLLAPGGIIVLDVPNIRKPFRSLDRYFLRYVHLSYFSPGTLRRLLAVGGFEVLHLDEGKQEIHSAQPLFVIAKPAAAPATLALSGDDWQELLVFLRRYRRRYPLADAPRLALRSMRRDLRRRLAASPIGTMVRSLRGHVAQP